MTKIRLRTAHGTYLRAGDLGEVNQTETPGPWEEFEMEDASKPVPKPPPDESESWRGNFLYPFFGPASIGLPDIELNKYFYQLADRGDRDVLLNADQDDWMGREGQREWGAPFVWFEGNNILRVKEVCQLAQSYRLRVHLGLFDQPRLGWMRKDRQEGGMPYSEQLDKMIKFMEELRGMYSVLMYSWEIGERWSDGSPESHEQMEARLGDLADFAFSTDPDVTFAIHHADGLRGGLNFYGSLPSTACRYMQYRSNDDDSQLRHKTRLIGEVAKKTGTKVCIMEHSSPHRSAPNYTEEEANRRGRLCYEELRKYLPPDRCGTMNGR